MPWPQIFSSSSSTSSNCSSSSSSRNQRQITRPKKFSNIQEIKGGGTPTTTCSYLDLARSPPPRLSSAMVAHPLPVPDLSSLFSSADRKLVSSAGCGGAEHFRLPSPDEVSVWDKDRERVKGKERVRGKERERLGDSLSRDDGAEGSSINFSNGRNRTSQTEVHDSIDAQRSVDRVQKWLTRNEPQTAKDLDRVQDNFSIQVPFRSAPASGYASPVLSPPKMNPGDLLSSYLMGPPQVWSAPEMPSKCMSSGLAHGVCQERTVLSRDSSPIRSPSVTSPLKTRKSTSESASPGHPKLCVESCMTYLESSNGHANVHPLPLPPGAASPSQISPVPRAATKPEYSPIKGQWQKGKIIGRGTFGSVYVATNRETGALCAMKEVELLPDDPKSAECMKQLEQEIKVLSQLKHPNIVQYFGSAIVEDRFYIYLEYVYPGSINKYVREHCGAITESVVRNFTRHILSGLAYLHSKKTIHRDIKGANLLVDASGIVKLADFGMAKLLTGQATDLSLKGSPYWMAPELMQAVIQKDNNSALAFAVDIWSLGCTIIEMLTGKPPWSEYEGAAAMFRVLKESPPIPESLSAEGKDFLRGCFRRNPAERPSASKLLEHRFVRTSHPQQPELPSFLAFGGLTLADKGQTTQTPGEVAYRRATSPNSRTAKRVSVLCQVRFPYALHISSSHCFRGKYLSAMSE